MARTTDRDVEPGTRAEPGDPENAASLEDAFRLQVVAFGHVTPGGEAVVSDHAVLAHCGRPSIFNRATALDLTQPDVTFGEIEDFYGGLPHALWVRDDRSGSEMDALVTERGYVALPPVPAMARGLPADDLPKRDGHRTVLVADPTDAAVLSEVATTGLGFGAEDRIVLEDFLRHVLRHARPFDHGAVYAVRPADRIVAVGLVLCTAGLAALVFLATMPGHRRHGLATAVITRALHDVATFGIPATGIVANRESAPLFSELGFREVSTYRAYRWVGR